MKKLATLSLLLLFINSSCAQWGKKIRGNGNYTTINRTTQDYNAITVGGWFNVQIVDGNEGRITLEGEENLLEHIKTEVKNGKLIVKIKNGINLKPSSWHKGIKVTIPVESINSISLSGSGDIVSKKIIKADSFATSLSGSGDINLTINTISNKATVTGSGSINLNGTTTNFNATVTGSGDMKAYELEANNVNAFVTGSGDVKVTVKNNFKAKVTGSGDIRYHGNPKKIDTKTTGSGDISKG